ncbi:1-deoxy-D-xylulose-5-phosphate reductoisomerase [candidate division WOR-1 bacterium RIFOXYB2_FULL_37_13]|uniref:1-deoxy-D-xylulose 5-phosphate reductoisomerase n=1 Tax=candidate division WOR-1 bacterium RIFOXYB2_FULL_37_13 TaxID=1802579 RepID=A0A1F4SDT2_UNCSA|nr:MAG: 1-deoxy-D-xylulose-5-phosphate reductoisomerase [candidate division WOR-1 bacterium RIFOXYB2_FULL_37_13]
MKKNIAILGSTGSIGKQALEVISAFPSSFNVVSIAAKNEVEDIISQIKIFKPLLVSVASEEVKEKIAAAISRQITKIVVGEEGLMEAATHKGVNLVVAAIPGAFSLKAVMEAVKAKKDIALATKEVLVAAGDIFMEEAKKAGIKIFPIDSEHSAIAQCLLGEKVENIKKIIITASGGPFLNATPEKLAKVTAKDALGHPTWKMGPKITIDSASLMNKGFEVIEAHYLFGLDYSKIEVVIHPQSIVHSMVEFIDGSIKAQLGAPDMRIPIQLALFGMERKTNRWNTLDIIKTKSLTFEIPDMEKFPCLKYAYDAGRKGGTMPAVVNAVNEVSVNLFLKGQCSFLDIPARIKKTMEEHLLIEKPSIEQVINADKWGRAINL